MLIYTVYSFFFLCHNIYKNEGNANFFLIGDSHFLRFRKFLIATDTDKISAYCKFCNVKVITRKAKN